MSKIKIRREKVKTLLIRGIKQTAIAKELGAGLRTIKRDVAAIRDELKKEIKSKKLEDILADFVIAEDGVYNEAWKTYYNATEESTKTRALRIIHSIISDKIKILQGLGVFGKELIPGEKGDLYNIKAIIMKIAPQIERMEKDIRVREDNS